VQHGDGIARSHDDLDEVALRREPDVELDIALHDAAQRCGEHAADDVGIDPVLAGAAGQSHVMMVRTTLRHRPHTRGDDSPPVRP
jgi:hypothetical protein